MPHDPTAACEAYHCYFHHEDEPADSTLAITCGECLHTFPDADALVEADNSKRAELGMGLRPEAVAHLIAASLARGTDSVDILDLIPVCPLCAHNF